MSEWILGILSDIATVKTGYSYSSMEFIEDGYRLLRISNIQGNTVSKTDLDVYIEHNDVYIDYEVVADDILIALSGATTGKVGLVRNDTLPAYLNQRVGSFEPKGNNCKAFIYYIVTNPKYYRAIMNNCPSSAQPNVSPKILESIEITYPKSEHEQLNIANILNTLDKVLEKTEAAIEKYKAIKAGMMQDLFTRGIDVKTGKLRPTFQEAPELYKETVLGWIPKEWEVVKIGDFSKIKGGKRMPAGKEFSDALTPFPYLRVTDMQNGSIDQSDLKYVPVEIEPLIRSYKISVEDVYVTIAGTLGLFGTIQTNLDQAQLTENAARICEFDKSVYDRDFIKHQCNSMIVQSQVVREIGVGGGVPKLALFRIAKFLFLKPSINEQQAIVERMRLIEHELREESITMRKYKQLKQGMMADLLTGNIRVEKHKCEVYNDRKSTNN